MAESSEKKVGDDDKDGQKPSDASEFSLSSLLNKLKLSGGKEKEETKKVLSATSLDGIVEYILSGECKNIVTMAGAGISTTAGIPDFRSPGTGLYDNLAEYNLPDPMAIFSIGYFHENPKPFFVLAKSLYPGTFKPTLCHYFIRLLQDKGLLLRHYTQNIDTLERVVGLKDDKLVEAHGTFHTSHCLKCRRKYTLEWMKEQIFSDKVPKCIKDKCNGVVKPDIVFFGESLPDKFSHCIPQDFPKCDLLIILGTSLAVQPFASLADRVSTATPRLYINLENTTQSSDPLASLFGMGHSFKFDAEDNCRDVFHQGTCDDGCLMLAEKLGWKDELDNLIKAETTSAANSTSHAADKETKPSPGKEKKSTSSHDKTDAKM